MEEQELIGGGLGEAPEPAGSSADGLRQTCAGLQDREDAGPPAADPETGDRPPSEARVNANRANAQRSTGPRTAPGKQRSSLNAFRHGVYAMRPHAVTTGFFPEDPEEVVNYVQDLVRALRPRDAVEQAAAEAVASAFLSTRRLSDIEAALLEAGVSIEGLPYPSGGNWNGVVLAYNEAESILALLYQDTTEDADEVLEFVAGQLAADETTMRGLAQAFSDAAGLEDVRLREAAGEFKTSDEMEAALRSSGLEFEEPADDSVERWWRLLRQVARMAYPTAAAAERHFAGVRDALGSQLAEVLPAQRSAVAQRMAPELTKILDLEARTSRNVARRLAVLRDLQARTTEHGLGERTQRVKRS